MANKRDQLARLSVDVKLFWAISLTIGILFCQSVIMLVILLFLTGSLWFLERRIASAFRKFGWVGIPAILIIFAVHLFYHGGEVLFKIGILTATTEGIREGLLNSLRFLNFGLVAIATFGGIEPVDFGRRIAWGLGIFRWRKLTDLALVFFIAIRFAPAFVEEMTIVRMAMVARGANFGGPWLNRIRMNMRLMLPLFSRVIRQADDIACAISLKGYKGIYLVGKAPRFRIGEIFLVVAAIGFGAVLVVS